MNPKYEQICQRIDTRLTVTPRVTGLLGGLASSPVGGYLATATYGGQLVFQSLLLSFACKFGIIAGGVGLGWRMGNQWYQTEEIFQEWVEADGIWRKILHHYRPESSQPSPASTKPSGFLAWFGFHPTVTPEAPIPTEIQVAQNLLDPTIEIGQLYRFCIYLYIERFNYFPTEEFQAMQEYKEMVLGNYQVSPMLSSKSNPGSRGGRTLRN